MKKNAVKYISVIIAAVILMMVPSSAFAANENIPTLFHNDEAWYKDGPYPLVERAGEYYVPSELFEMFDYIEVTAASENNLLIHNTASGEYISLLFKEQSAAINGVIMEDVVMFRDSGVYYVNAEIVSDAVGIRSEYYFTEDGQTVLRLYDSSRKLALGTLLQSYMPVTDEYGGAEEEENVLKKIYIICKTPSGVKREYVAKYNLDTYGLEYTLMLTSKVDADDILEAYSMGTYGVVPTYSDKTDGAAVAEELDRMNATFSEYTKKHTKLTLSTGNDKADKSLESQGYIVIKPDFTVNGGSNINSLFADMIAYLTKNGVCVVLLEDCWNSGEMARLISEIDYPYYTTSNLSNAN